MTTPRADLVFGVELELQLDWEERNSFEEAGLTASPQIYTMEDEPTHYIVGVLMGHCGAGETSCMTRKMKKLTKKKKEKLTQKVVGKMAELGYAVELDPGEKMQLFLNCYYY